MSKKYRDAKLNPHCGNCFWRRYDVHIGNDKAVCIHHTELDDHDLKDTLADKYKVRAVGVHKVADDALRIAIEQQEYLEHDLVCDSWYPRVKRLDGDEAARESQEAQINRGMRYAFHRRVEQAAEIIELKELARDKRKKNKKCDVVDS